MLLNIVAIIAASVLAFAVHVVVGRLVGLGTTVICSAAIAFFLMAPVRSFRISQTSDLIALSLYGTLGLAVAKSAPSRKNRAVIGEGSVQNDNRLKCPEADIQAIMTEFMSSDVGIRLRDVDISIDMAHVGLTCLYDDALRILTDVFTAALRDSETQRISVYGGRRPGVQFLIVTAHRVWPPPLHTVITIGQRDENCEPAVFGKSPSKLFDSMYFPNLALVARQTPYPL